MFGLLNINKPVGPTSHDIVAGVRKLVGRRKHKVGHAGTLDPFADGVLIVCVGQATRLADYIQQQTKQYRAGVTLGASSDTHDIQGEITLNPGAAAVSEADLREAIKAFVGRIDQIPPAHSAIHVNGRRAYDLARAGRDVDLPAREVNICDITLVDFAWPEFTIDITCGAGTYIRSLARDIGRKLGVGAYCGSLTRTAIGKFSIDSAVAPADVDPAADLIDPIEALDSMTRVAVEPEEANRLAMGKTAAPVRAPDAPTPEIAVTDRTGGLLALAKLTGQGDRQLLQPTKVFVKPQPRR